MPSSFLFILNRRGISLLEGAMALAILGLIIAGIWAISGSAFGSSKKNQLAEQVIGALDGTRSYVRQTDLGTTILNHNDLLRTGVLPTNLVRNGQVANVYGGSFNISASKISIAFSLTQIPSDACVDLLYARLGANSDAVNNLGFVGYVAGSYASMNNLTTDFRFNSVTSFCQNNTSFAVAFTPL